MRSENAHFNSLDYWLNNKCKGLSDVLDFSRCLENMAFPVINEWYALEGGEDLPQPDIDKMLQCAKFDLTEYRSDNPKTGWLMAKMPKPYISRYFNNRDLGEFYFTYYTRLDLDIYCDERIIAPYSYMGGRFAMNVGCEKDHYVYLRIDHPNDTPICDIVARCYLSGMSKMNNAIKDLARSLRAGCHLLSKENRRDNLYLSGIVNINRSKLTEKEYENFSACLIDTANFILEHIRKDDLLNCLQSALYQLKPVAEYAHRFTVYFIGHSHMDLAWKWRYQESIECMKGTLETQLSLMEREPEYVYVETSAVLWRDLKEKYPDFWKRVLAAADRGQFEPQGGMWCETDGQCVGAESWFRQIEYGQKTAKETCGKESTVAINVDGFGFNAGLPKILKKCGIPYFVTQKLRYNEFTLFPYIHFWWESDDGSRILTLHEYPGHANHIEPDELAKAVCIHHMTDGFYHIPIMWGYGNHGGGPLPVMMDRIDELKSQTVFPNVKYSGFNEFYKILCETEDTDGLPVVKGELFLETHQKTFTVQSKTKYLNRECERRLLNAESLQAATDCYYNLDIAWQRHLFNQFHDVLAGTSLRQVYEDVYSDYQTAFKNIDKSNRESCQKALGEGKEYYIFNPLSFSFTHPVILDEVPDCQNGFLIDSRGNRVIYQKTYDNRTVFLAKDLPAYGFERYKRCGENSTPKSTILVSKDSVDNGVIKVLFDESEGVIKSLIYKNGEFCGDKIGQLKVLEDTLSRDYDSWNFGFTGKDWDVICNSFELIESGPVRAVFRAKYSFGIWQDKKPYYSTYLWHTPGVEYPTSFFTQDFIVYADDSIIRCELNAEWWEDKKDIKVSAQTNIENPRAFYKIPFGEIERPVKRDTPYEKARFEVPAITYGDLRNEFVGFALLNRSKHGYDALNNCIRLSLLTAPYGDDKAKVPDSTADRGKHRIEYAFLPHLTGENLEKISESYERGIMVLYGNEKPSTALGKSLIQIDNIPYRITSVRLLPNGDRVKCRAVDETNSIYSFEIDNE